MIESPASVAAGAPEIPLQRRRGLLVSERRLLLVCLDLLAVAAAYIAAFNLRTAHVRNVGIYIPRTGTVIAAGMWLLAAQFTDAYNLRRAASVRRTLQAVGGTLAISAGGMLLIFFAVPFWLTRPTILLWVPIAGCLVMGMRLAYRRTLTSSALAQPIALVATSRVLETIWPDVREAATSFYRVRHVIDPTKPDTHEKLAALAAGGTASEVVLGVRDEISRELFTGLLRCYDSGVRVRSLADLYEELTGRLLLDQLGHAWLTSLPMRSETSRVYSLCKRVTDVGAALAGLAVLGLILPLAAPLIRLDGGPVFYRQERVGKYGRVFRLTKLRTMRIAPDGDSRWTERRDARVTWVGAILRALHVDELPQMWNILRGDMSLIGPRPEQPHYVRTLTEAIDFYPTRLTVRPGLTGWAQVNHGYGSGVDGTRVKLSYDLYYIKRQSVALDLVIAARTIRAVLAFKGS